MTLEIILLVGDSNQFLLKKSVTEIKYNRLVNHWALIHLKETSRCFYFLVEKKYEKSTVKYINLEYDNVRLQWK